MSTTKNRLCFHRINQWQKIKFFLNLIVILFKAYTERNDLVITIRHHIQQKQHRRLRRQQQHEDLSLLQTVSVKNLMEILILVVVCFWMLLSNILMEHYIHSLSKLYVDICPMNVDGNRPQHHTANPILVYQEC